MFQAPATKRGRNPRPDDRPAVGDPERLAAVAAFVGEAAANVGRPLSLGGMKRGIVVLGGHRVVVTGFGSGFAGLRLADEVAIDKVFGEARSLLGWDGSSSGPPVRWPA